jgi:hypothetical protein
MSSNIKEDIIALENEVRLLKEHNKQKAIKDKKETIKKQKIFRDKQKENRLRMRELRKQWLKENKALQRLHRVRESKSITLKDKSKKKPYDREHLDRFY